MKLFLYLFLAPLLIIYLTLESCPSFAWNYPYSMFDLELIPVVHLTSLSVVVGSCMFYTGRFVKVVVKDMIVKF